MVKNDLTTEERILEAAKEVFHRRGFEGTRMQEIADSAGINKALVHYYFRNKENLFAAVFTAAFEKLTTRGMEIFSLDVPFEEKLATFLDYHISFLRQNSHIPWFILNGLHERPDQLKEMMMRNGSAPAIFLNHIREGLNKEGIVIEDPVQLFANILSLSVFPVVAKPLLSRMFNLSEEQMDTFYEDRKKQLPGFIMNAIRKT
jgi:TetR/AcrR family transcriptional regulator